MELGNNQELLTSLKIAFSAPTDLFYVVTPRTVLNLQLKAKTFILQCRVKRYVEHMNALHFQTFNHCACTRHIFQNECPWNAKYRLKLILSVSPPHLDPTLWPTNFRNEIHSILSGILGLARGGEGGRIAEAKRNRYPNQNLNSSCKIINLELYRGINCTNV